MRLPCLLATALLAALPAAAPAQEGRAPLLPSLRAGGEAESYLRVLQAAGEVPLHPWSVRGFSPREADHLAPRGEHPWARRFGAAEDAPRIAAVPLSVELRYNSAFPYGSGDGPVWAGRGATLSAAGGMALRAGPLTIQAAPQAFWTQNRAFPLRETDPAASEYADPRAPRRIDRPQRFGEGAFARVDPGESYLRLDVGRLAVGASTAVQAWGPAERLPLILGSDAPGLPHLFVETAAPVNVGIGRLRGRIFWGEAGQSAYSPIPAGEHGSRRFVTAAAAVFTPHFAPGLEVGGTRFYHLAWPRGGVGVREFAKLLDPFAKSSLPDLDGSGFRAQPDNQLISVFARWVLPGVGVEVWGEFGREDHNWDLLDFYMQPDQQSAYLLGFRKVWRGRGEAMWAARGELLDAQVSHLLHVRPQYPFHQHLGTPQGHTHRGQPLGAASAHGGGGWVAGADRFSRGGRTSLEWTFTRVDQRWTYQAGGEPSTRGTDVMHALEANGVRFLGRGEVAWGVGGVVNLNRHFGADAFNFNGRIGFRFVP